jgi:5-hydroxyisourate hydrolase-like protein (transthyretin family)
VGGGQLRVTTGDSVLWALVKGYQPLVPLRLKGPQKIVAASVPRFKVTVLDGETRKPIPLVTVGGKKTINGQEQTVAEKKTNIDGQVEIESGAAGTFELKAYAADVYVRSNVLKVTVTA